MKHCINFACRNTYEFNIENNDTKKSYQEIKENLITSKDNFMDKETKLNSNKENYNFCLNTCINIILLLISVAVILVFNVITPIKLVKA